jgi:glycosyltransferase involved in cell wall biosynthesis
MKILFLTGRIGRRNGWEKYSLDLISSLRAKGIEGIVVVAKVNEEIVGFDQRPMLPPTFSTKRICFGAHLYARRIARFVRLSGDLPDIIHCMEEPYAPITRLLARKLGRPYVITAHGSFAVRPFSSPVYGLFQRKAYDQAACIVAVSHYTERRLKEYISSDALLTVINNGVNAQVATAITAKSLESVPSARGKEQLILSVGACKERKGQIYVVMALPEILKRVPGARYVIVGDQTDAAYLVKLRECVRSNGLEDVVEFKHGLTDSELSDLYGRAKVFALTPVSTTFNFEGFGLVYLEANLRGVPSVGSYGNGGEDAIKAGETGFLTKPADPVDIADKIIRVLSMSDGEYKRMSVQAKIWAGSMSWPIMADKYLAMYHDVSSVRKDTRHND